MAKTTFKKAGTVKAEFPAPAQPLVPQPQEVTDVSQVVTPPAPPTVPQVPIPQRPATAIPQRTVGVPVPMRPQAAVPQRPVVPAATPAGNVRVAQVQHRPVVPAPQPLAVQPPQQLAVPAQNQQIGTISGSVDSTDFQLSYIKFVQFIGDALQMGFAAGDILMDTNIGLYRAGMPPVKVIVMIAKKQFQEDTPFGTIPTIVDTPSEVYSHGGTLAWVNNEKPTWMPVLRCGVLIEKPEVMFDEHGQPVDAPQFHMEFGGARYAAASILFRKTGYKAAKTIFTLANSYPLHTLSLELATKVEQGSLNNYVMPTIRLAGGNDPELIKWVEGVHAGVNLNNDQDYSE